jgi:hypothetical protein
MDRRAPHRFFRPLLALLSCLLAAPAALPAQRLVPVDRIVAVVDEDPIFHSDLTRALAFGFARPGRVPGDLRPVLDQLIDERLRAHDIDRYGVPPAPEAEVDAQLNRIEAAHGGTAALDAELLAVGSTREELRRAIDLQLRVLTYVDERLAPRVFVDDDEVGAYYQGELKSEMAGQGKGLPALAEVREGIRSVLRERKLTAETREWTANLRRGARIADLLDRPSSTPQDLPPEVFLIAAPKS